MNKTVYYDTGTIVYKSMNYYLNQIQSGAAMEKTLELAALEEGFRYIVLFLREAVMFNSPALFRENMDWLLQTEVVKPASALMLEEMLNAIQKVLWEETDFGYAEAANAMLTLVLAQRSWQSTISESYLLQQGSNRELGHQYLRALLSFEVGEAEALLRRYSHEVQDVRAVYQSVIQPVQYEIGRLWQAGQLSVAQEHYCTAMTRGIVRQLIREQHAAEKTDYRFLGICAGKELHSIGIQMVCDYFSLAGWQVFYLGANTPQDGVAELVREQQIDVIGIAVTIPYYLHYAAEAIQMVKQEERERRPYIMVGGQAFSQCDGLWRKAGADCYAESADAAVRLALQHCQQRQKKA